MEERTERILKIFEAISQIPRESHHEEKIRSWLVQWSQERGYLHQTDQGGNLLVKVPATPGREKSPTIILQSHMDMVCEKWPSSSHDFSKDPITLVRDGDWLKAKGTTLGADDGIGIAISLGLVGRSHPGHPPLELLFTTSEETGLMGAQQLDSALLTGRTLINIDAEKEGVFITGCAGGNLQEARFSASLVPLQSSLSFYKLSISGLTGGHSGSEIHLRRASSLKLLARLLSSIEGSFFLVALEGGGAHNAIARSASAEIALSSQEAEKFSRQVETMRKDFQKEFCKEEAGMRISFESSKKGNRGPSCRGLREEDSKRLVDVLMAYPHGVASYVEGGGLVQTSSNLAFARIGEEGFSLIGSQRSSLESELDEIIARGKAVVSLGKGKESSSSRYPCWTPKSESAVCRQAEKIYQKTFGEKPQITVIHAGLECGLLGEKIPDMDMISLGPSIYDAHSPDERLFTPSVEKVVLFLENLLASF